jgi:hypothetical protein
MREPDANEFLLAVQAEISAHEQNNPWVKVPHSSVPPGNKLIHAVRAMRWKACPDGTLSNTRLAY